MTAEWLQRAAQLAKRERLRAKDGQRGHQPGAVDLRDQYAALPEEEDLRPVSTRTSPRRGRTGEHTPPAAQAPAKEALAGDRIAFEAGGDSGSDTDGGLSDVEDRDGAGGVPRARAAADAGAVAPRGGTWEALALVCLRLRSLLNNESLEIVDNHWQ